MTGCKIYWYLNYIEFIFYTFSFLMSGYKYFITDQHATYFITCRVIHWIELFTKNEYRNIIVESPNYCIHQKNLQLYSWDIMSNHIHIVATILRK